MEEQVRTITTYPATCCAVLSFVMAGVVGGFALIGAPFIQDRERSKTAMQHGMSAAGVCLFVGVLLLIGIGLTADGGRAR